MANTRVRKPWQSGQYTVYLWEFLYGLLQDPECCSLITWTDKDTKQFCINNAQEIAKLWGTVKNRPTMDDKKLLRALRYYYKTKILRKIKGRKGVYQFLSLPYEEDGCDQKVKNSGRNSSQPFEGAALGNFTDFSTTTADCSERLTDDRERAEKSGERIVKNREEMETNFDECHGYRSRTESSSESSLSSDSSSTTRSLDELQADLLNSGEVLQHVDFVFNNDINVEMCQGEHILDW